MKCSGKRCEGEKLHRDVTASLGNTTALKKRGADKENISFIEGSEKKKERRRRAKPGHFLSLFRDSFGTNSTLACLCSIHYLFFLSLFKIIQNQSNCSQTRFLPPVW